MHVAGPQRRGEAVAVLSEQKQRVVADGRDVSVIGAPFLRTVHRALARIHVEHDPVGGRRQLGLREHRPVHGPQPGEIFLVGQQLGLKPVQRRCQRPTPVPALWRPDEAKRRVRRHAHRVVEVFVTREPAVDRLPQEIRQAELGVPALSGVVQISEMSVSSPRRSSNSRTSRRPASDVMRDLMVSDRPPSGAGQLTGPPSPSITVVLNSLPES